MGLSNFPSASDGVLPVLVMNTVLSVALLKNMVRSLLQAVGATWSSITSSTTSSNFDIDDSDGYPDEIMNARERRISITQFKSLCHDRYSSSSSCVEVSASASSAAADGGCCNSGSKGGSGSGWANYMIVECCVCLCGFEADEEVSELSCKHFFHKGCLEKWFDNKHTTCPLCRSIH